MMARLERRKAIEEWFEDEERGNEEIKQSEARLAKLRSMEKNLQQLRLEWENIKGRIKCPIWLNCHQSEWFGDCLEWLGIQDSNLA